MQRLLTLGRAGSQGINSFQRAFEEFVASPPTTADDRKKLVFMADHVVQRQLNAKEALRVIKDHVQQGTGWDAAHRIRALAVIDFLSSHSTVGCNFMEQLATIKWRDRLKKAATESFSPPLQDAVVQLIFKWATAWRSHDYGISMEQLLFELEGEGIILEGSWKVDGPRPTVIALGSSPTSASPRAADAEASRQDPVSPGSSGTAHAKKGQYTQAALLSQAEGMSQDAVALACASDALAEALEAPTVEDARSPELHTRGQELQAKVTLHVAHLQEGLSRASLTDLAMAQLCEVADALNTQQERWQTLSQQYTSRVAPTGEAQASGANGHAQAPKAPVETAMPAKPALDLLSLDDDIGPAPAPVDAASQPSPAIPAAGTSAALRPPPVTVLGPSPGTVPALAVDIDDPFAELAAVPTPRPPVSSTPGSVSSQNTIALAGASAGSYGAGLPPQPVPGFASQGSALSEAPLSGLEGAASLPLSSSNPFVEQQRGHVDLQHSGSGQPTWQPPTPGPALPQHQSWQEAAPRAQLHQTPSMPAYADGYMGQEAMLPHAVQQELMSLRMSTRGLQDALVSASAQHAASLAAMQARHEQELAMVSARAAQAMAGMHERIALLEQELASRGAAVSRQASLAEQGSMLAAPGAFYASIAPTSSGHVPPALGSTMATPGAAATAPSEWVSF